MIGTKKLMELFENYSGRLRVHEANVEVTVEIGGVPIPITVVSWRSRKLSGRRQYTMVLHPDADELAYMTQQRAQAVVQRAQEPHDDSEGIDLLPPARCAR